jgi:hypothetical protein
MFTWAAPTIKNSLPHSNCSLVIYLISTTLFVGKLESESQIQLAKYFYK